MQYDQINALLNEEIIIAILGEKQDVDQVDACFDLEQIGRAHV